MEEIGCAWQAFQFLAEQGRATTHTHCGTHTHTASDASLSQNISKWCWALMSHPFPTILRPPVTQWNDLLQDGFSTHLGSEAIAMAMMRNGSQPRGETDDI
jgi:hypothetical protein